MKKSLMTLMVISAFLFFTFGNVFSADQYGHRTFFQSPQHLSEVIGSKVVNYQGHDLGTVHDLVADEEGRLEYLILAKDYRIGVQDTGPGMRQDTTGIPGQLVAIPLDAVSPRMTDDELRINVDQAVIAQAPTFSAGQYPDYADRRWQQQSRGYFGGEIQPGVQAPPTQLRDGANPWEDEAWEHRRVPGDQPPPTQLREGVNPWQEDPRSGTAPGDQAPPTQLRDGVNPWQEDPRQDPGVRRTN
jgi:sporulation protein YlmC with PRC-barrel domain